MAKLFIPGGSMGKSRSCWGAAGVVCILGALAASCANGVPIGSEEVLFLPPGARPLEDEPQSPEGVGDDLNELGEDGEGSGLTPAAADSEVDRGEELPRAEQPSEPADEEPDDEDREQVPPGDLPISNPDEEPTPDPDPDPGPAPGNGQNPSGQPGPVPPSTPQTPPVSEPTVPPPVTTPDPDPVPPVIDDVPLPSAGHCLAGWEGSSCDTCSGQTQSDRLACRDYIDCYITNNCDPGSCGSVEQSCGVNRIGNGFAPKDIADAVYGCMCGP